MQEILNFIKENKRLPQRNFKNEEEKQVYNKFIKERIESVKKD